MNTDNPVNRDEIRGKILKEFSRVWDEFPQFKFGHLISLIFRSGTKQFYSTDEETLKLLTDPQLTIHK
jgi:hypothetical protein